MEREKSGMQGEMRERLCEVIHRPEKTGERCEGKNKRATVIIQIFVRLEVKAECVSVLHYDSPFGSYFMYYRQQLGLYFKLSSIHPSVPPPSTLSRELFFCPSIIPPPVLPAIHQHIDKKKAIKHLCWTSHLHPSTPPPPHNASSIYILWLSRCALPLNHHP